MVKMSFQEYAEPRIRMIERFLDQTFNKLYYETKNNLPKIADLIRLFFEANEGGSRLRGALVILGYETFGGKDRHEAAKAAAALEIFQTAILAQDDFMDKSELRRGRPALYKAIAAWHKKYHMIGDPLHFGVSQAIALSDFGFFLASNLILELRVASENKLRVLSIFNRLVVDTALGQVLDLTLPATTRKKTKNDILTVERYKTAQYTAVGPLAIGAYLAGADEKSVDTIRLFGECIGIAFQIKDDIKGVFGNPRETGKSAYDDIAEGKITLLYMYAARRASRSQRVVIDTLYGKHNLTATEADQVRNIFRTTGALSYAKKQQEIYCKKALLLLKAIIYDQSLIEVYRSLVATI